MNKADNYKWMRAHTWTKEQALRRGNRLLRAFSYPEGWEVKVVRVRTLLAPLHPAEYNLPPNGYWYVLSLRLGRKSRGAKVVVTESLWAHAPKYTVDVYYFQKRISWRCANVWELEPQIVGACVQELSSTFMRRSKQLHQVLQALHELSTAKTGLLATNCSRKLVRLRMLDKDLTALRRAVAGWAGTQI